MKDTKAFAIVSPSEPGPFYMAHSDRSKMEDALPWALRWTGNGDEVIEPVYIISEARYRELTALVPVKEEG